MACMSKHHQELTDGVGKCSVPMWMQGCPAGFCDRPAYGTPEPCQQSRDAWTGEMKRLDGRYNGYVPALACPAHGGPAGHTCPRCDEPNPNHYDLDGCRDPDCPEQGENNG